MKQSQVLYSVCVAVLVQTVGCRLVIDFSCNPIGGDSSGISIAVLMDLYMAILCLWLSTSSLCIHTYKGRALDIPLWLGLWDSYAAVTDRL